MIEIRPNGPVSESRIADAETRLGVTFPGPYRQWLATTGGGPTTDSIVIPGSNDLRAFGRFLGIGGDPGFDLTEVQRSGFAEVVPEEFLVIAYGHGGSICIRVSGESRGSVWWADYELSLTIAPDGGPTPEVMRKLADDFDAFIASLP
jgi:hypothetical protein